MKIFRGSTAWLSEEKRNEREMTVSIFFSSKISKRQQDDGTWSCGRNTLPVRGGRLGSVPPLQLAFLRAIAFFKRRF